MAQDPNQNRPADVAQADSVGGMAKRLLNPAHLSDLARRSAAALKEQGAEQLGDDVRQHVAPREQAVDGLGDGHGRVDVRAGDATEHEHREHDAEAVAHGDVQPAGVVALGVLELNVGHGAIAEDHQNGGTEECGRKFDKSRVFHCCFLYGFFSVRIRLMSIPLSADNSVQHYSPHWKSSTKRLDRPSACRTVIQKSENKKALEPKFQGFICAPSGIRTLDTLIKSQLL